MSELVGTVALVTGATSGIGGALTRSLAGRGAQVVAVGRREDRLTALREELGSEQCHVVSADLTDPAAANAAVAGAIERFGRLDLVVNNAGVMLNGPTIEADLTDWDAMVDLNLKALMYVAKAALPHLVRAASTSPRGVADLVNISSIAGRTARATVAVYNGTKFAVTAMSESWRQEFAPKNVRVSVVEPGAVDTELFSHQRASVQRGYQQLFAAVEKLRPDDVAEVVASIVTAPRRVAIAEVVVRPTDQV